jgi:hypothetical protein
MMSSMSFVPAPFVEAILIRRGKKDNLDKRMRLSVQGFSYVIHRIRNRVGCC